MDAKETHKQSKNTNCPALLTIKIWAPNFCPIIENEKWPCTVEFFAEHNHSVLTPSVLRYRPLSDETINALLELFRRGHTPSSAYAAYYADQMISFGDDFQASTSDRSYFPSKQDVANLWKKDFKSNYGGRVGEDMFASLEEKLSNLTNDGYQCGLSRMEDSYVVSICTPLMQRAHSTQAAKEVVFVDATGNCGIEKHTVYFFVAYCSGVGGIPLGCIITDSKKNHMFEEGLRMFFEDFIDVFGDPPQVIMTDEDFSEIRVLHKFFPQTKFLLCMYNVAKTCWNWLLNKHYNISKDIRQRLYLHFKDMVYANSAEEFKHLEDTMSELAVSELQFASFVAKMITRKDTWTLYNRKKYSTRDYNVNNVLEVIFRLFKDISFEQTKSSNLVQLVDYITSPFEKRFAQGLWDVVHGNLHYDGIKRLCSSLPYVDEKCVKKITDYMYCVKCESAKAYDIDIGLGICSCPTGTKGRMCAHQLAVLKKHDLVYAQKAFSDEDAKELLWISGLERDSICDFEEQEERTENISVPDVSSIVEISTEFLHNKTPGIPNSLADTESVCLLDNLSDVELVCQTDSLQVEESACQPVSLQVVESVCQPVSLQVVESACQPVSLQVVNSVCQPGNLQVQESASRPIIEIVHGSDSLSQTGVESVCKDIDSMCSKLKKCVQEDPINMIPAVKGFLQMFELKSQNSAQLISTLYTAFCGILPTNIKSKHFSSVDQRLNSSNSIGNSKK